MDRLFDLESYLDKYGSKTKAVYYGIRDQIIQGILKKDSLLPTTRNLASALGIARGTITAAYEMLLADGYLYMQQGVGTFVAFKAGNTPTSKQKQKPRLSDWGQRLPTKRLANVDTRAGAIDMQAGFIDEALFPEAAWQHAVNYARRDGSYRRFLGHQAAGLFSLRETIAAYLNRHRGLSAQPENIVITNGSQQAILLLCQLLVRPKDPVIIEDPSYSGTWQAIRLQGGKPRSISVDDDGVIPGDWPGHLAFLTPACQYPTGVVLSLKRRQTILKWAAKNNAIIVEDEYDSEFLRESKLIQPLKALDGDDRVVYLGSYSKSVGNFLRIGYAVLPEALVQPFIQAKSIYETYTSGVLEQAALDHFIRSRAYERHIRKMNKTYNLKYKLIKDLMDKYLSDKFYFPPSVAGLHLFGWWSKSSAQLDRFANKAKKKNVYFRTAGFNDQRLFRPYAAFGYSHLKENEITQAVKILAEL